MKKELTISIVVLGIFMLVSVSAHSYVITEFAPLALIFFEGFDDDFGAGRNVPDLVDPALSTQFSAINEGRPGASGKLTLRDRDILDPGGQNPYPSVILDFTDGTGRYVTFRFDVGPSYAITGGTVSFDVVRYGGDGGSIFKFVSSDGVTFTQVGNNSDAHGTHIFPAATGGNSTFLRVKVGTTGGIYEGVHIDNAKAIITAEPLLITVTINIDPNTLNVDSKGKWVTAYIELPEEYDPLAIDVNTVTITRIDEEEVFLSSISDEKYGFVYDPEEHDEDNDGIPEFMAKFDRQLLIPLLETLGDTEITVAGELEDGAEFEGSDTIRIIQRSRKENKGKGKKK